MQHIPTLLIYGCEIFPVVTVRRYYEGKVRRCGTLFLIRLSAIETNIPGGACSNLSIYRIQRYHNIRYRWKHPATMKEHQTWHAIMYLFQCTPSSKQQEGLSEQPLFAATIDTSTRSGNLCYNERPLRILYGYARLTTLQMSITTWESVGRFSCLPLVWSQKARSRAGDRLPDLSKETTSTIARLETYITITATKIWILL